MIDGKTILPLNDLMEEYAPNYLETISKNDEINRQARLDDGTLYAFMLINSEGHRINNAGGLQVREDWLEKLGLSSIAVCGMVKDDRHRTRGLYYQNVEIPIDRHSEGFKLITRIQDEAHRFAIEYHRSLRSKTQVRSVLDDIEGIGPARRKALMRRFKTLEAVRDASVEELSETEGMNRRAAESVYGFFHGTGNVPGAHTE